MRALVIVALLSSTADARPCVEETTIHGLWICGEPEQAPSHGGEGFVRNAQYKLENRGTKPLVVELRALEVLDPQDAPLRLAIDHANFFPSPANVRRATIAPGAKHELVIFGKGSIAKLRYHVVYRHRVVFRVDGVERSVRASEMYFRYPHKRNR